MVYVQKGEKYLKRSLGGMDFWVTESYDANIFDFKEGKELAAKHKGYLTSAMITN